MVISIFGNSVFEDHTSKLVKFASIFGNFFKKSLVKIFPILQESFRILQNLAKSCRILQNLSQLGKFASHMQVVISFVIEGNFVCHVNFSRRLETEQQFQSCLFYNFASRSSILMIFTFLKMALKFIGSSSLLEECGSKNKVA